MEKKYMTDNAGGQLKEQKNVYSMVSNSLYVYRF